MHVNNNEIGKFENKAYITYTHYLESHVSCTSWSTNLFPTN